MRTDMATRRDVLKALAVLPAARAARTAGDPLVSSGFVYEQAPFPSCHASTIVEAGADLLAAWFGGQHERAPDVAIWTARFDGQRWSGLAKVAEEPDIPTWNPVLWREPGGGIILFYKAGPSPETWSGFLKRSADGGRTWSDPELLPAGVLGPIKNKPLLGAGGEIVAGSSVESYRAWTSWVEISADGARTWTRHGPIVVPGVAKGNIQPALWRGRGGRLRMVVRTTERVGRVCLAESRDEGRTWSEARPTTLRHPNSGLDVVKLADGRVLLVHNDTTSGRTPLTVTLSEDDGDTWRPRLALEDGPGEYSYPAVIQAADGKVHVTYTWRRERIKHVVLWPADL
jgi:predicted neuraminidase